jgi:hypothetical protein
MCLGCRGAIRKKESSFSEEKEAKILLSICAVIPDLAWCKRMKVFWFFFSKKNMLA